MADKKTFHLEVITPERKFYDDDVWMIEMTTSEGDIGVYADHVPLTTVLAPGVLRIYKEEEEVREAAVLDGFVEILPDKVVILSQASEWPEEIDLHRAQEAKTRAERRIAANESDTNLTRAEIALKKSIIRIGLAGGSKL